MISSTSTQHEIDAEDVMLVVCWSPKGGSGTSVVAAGLAVASTRTRQSARTIVIDLAGDIPPILGLVDAAVGLSEWITQPTAFDFDELIVECTPRLSVLPRGNSPLPEPRSGAWTRLSLELAKMSAEDSTIIVDAGMAPSPFELRPLIGREYMVVRPCYLALRRARRIDHSSHATIVVREPNRVLVSADVESVLGLPIVAEVSLTADVARRIDAGVIATRPPATLLDELGPVVANWFA